ncbi:NAD(P)H-binding protein [Actinacidiphila acididurans]|uniref:NAD(P)H-binding protein n=1 Tax=Actinacidiphila acididurans TaxID=2784346 RepID=A0ABS2TS81_9ACTN|nr:NAD(P)H-binding protein [Actinacidiphila acididurans]MBM9506192.1 NAD(P)H-binding protein [Actinacidiphila acididurans]
MARIVVLGGSGKVGRRLMDELTARGHLAVAASRGSTTRFDWHDPATWPGAVAGADGVFVVGPGSARDWSDRLTGFLETAAAASVRHAVLLSARGVEFLPGGAVDRAEQALAGGPVAWTILRPSHFAQNFTEAMFAPVDGTVRAPVGAGAEPFIDVRDIAEVAATVLAGRLCTGESIALSGPSALTFDRAAAILSDTSGVPVRFEDEDREAHIARLRAAGTPEGYVRWRMAMLDGIRSGADAYVSAGVERILGRPATDFAAWARREVPGSSWAAR